MAKKKNILYLIRPSQGGIRTHLILLARSLSAQKFKVFIASPRENNLEKEFSGSDIVVFPIDLAPDFRIIRDLKAIFSLTRLIKENQIEIIHSHGYKAALLGCLAGKLARIPHIIFTVHNFIVDEKAGIIKRWLYSLVEKRLPGWAEKIITDSDILRTHLLEVSKVEEQKVQTVYLGIDVDKYNYPEELSEYKKKLVPSIDSPLITTIARLAPQKGVIYLLQAAEEVVNSLSDAQFIIAGDGPERGELESFVLGKRLERNVQFLGFRNDIKEILYSSDIVVSPSVSEGFPMIFLEAMAAKKAIVATNVGGTPEAVIDGVNGFLVPAKDPAALSKAILNLLRERQKIKEFGQASRLRVEKYFTVQKMVEKIEKIYDEISRFDLDTLY